MKSKALLLPALFTLSVPAFAANPAYNVALVSDYLFRGLTQTDNGPAIQGGADVRNGNAYGGIWFSNVDTPDDSEGLPVEMDVYFGYNNQFGSFNLDMEVLTYNYLNDSIADETEFKLGTSPAKGLAINIYRGVKGKTWYPEVTYEKFLPYRLYLDLAAGYWTQDDADDDAFTARAELARDFPELGHIDLFVGADFISDETPFGDDADEDDSELTFVVGIRKNF
ncbi:MAG: TorF family putative porin [Pseudomonadota bacterium]|nr:TorF family putative porin [Pseudomonadota bacterium]